jgi:TonB family protein
MGTTYRAFGSLILLHDVFADDLGHVIRAGSVTEGAIDKILWLRVLDGEGLPGPAIIKAFEIARGVAGTIQSSQLPSDPRFVDHRGVAAVGCEYVPGQPLNRVLARARDEAFPMQADNALLIADKLAIALSASLAVEVRGQALAHGFLHPGLVYLSLDGEAVLTGLGLGEALLDALEDPTAVVGVRPYLAPEVLASRSPSKRGDVYSLGAILFHLLTGTALPAAVGERSAALDAALLADTGEALPADIQTLLVRALAPSPSQRFSSAVDLRAELERLIYGGNYSPTTFNLALFMDRLFRAEIEADETALAKERALDPTPYLESEPEPEPEPEALAPSAPPSRRSSLPWLAVAGAAVVVAVTAMWWLWDSRSSQPPPIPTPTAEEIAARRQAQEDRLTAMTQEMVKQMMAEREEEIREELIARQTRIEELQRRLVASEKRASQGSGASKSEAEIQQALKREIAAAEQAQREQQEALEAKRKQAALDAERQELQKPTPSPAPPTTRQAATSSAATGGAVGKTPVPVEATNAPTQLPPTPRASPAAARIRVGDFVPAEQVDSPPVVIKTKPLEWPRSALRSQRKGVVVVQVTVNASGGVDEVSILRADDTTHGIPEAAVEAASGYHFKPGIKNGVAVTTHAFITWRYDFTDH